MISLVNWCYNRYHQKEGANEKPSSPFTYTLTGSVDVIIGVVYYSTISNAAKAIFNGVPRVLSGAVNAVTSSQAQTIAKGALVIVLLYIAVDKFIIKRGGSALPKILDRFTVSDEVARKALRYVKVDERKQESLRTDLYNCRDVAKEGIEKLTEIKENILQILPLHTLSEYYNEEVLHRFGSDKNRKLSEGITLEILSYSGDKNCIRINRLSDRYECRLQMKVIREALIPDNNKYYPGPYACVVGGKHFTLYDAGQGVFFCFDEQRVWVKEHSSGG